MVLMDNNLNLVEMCTNALFVKSAYASTTVQVYNRTQDERILNRALNAMGVKSCAHVQ